MEQLVLLIIPKVHGRRTSAASDEYHQSHLGVVTRQQRELGRIILSFEQSLTPDFQGQEGATFRILS